MTHIEHSAGVPCSDLMLGGYEEYSPKCLEGNVSEVLQANGTT
jgi:hypothetical protein